MLAPESSRDSEVSSDPNVFESISPLYFPCEEQGTQHKVGRKIKMRPKPSFTFDKGRFGDTQH